MTIVTGFYAALLGLGYVGLSIRTLRIRRRLRIAVGDGGSAEMLRAIRVHGNFAEYTPMALLLIALAEMNGAPAIAIHGLNLLLLVGRSSHAWGVSRVAENFRYRVVGMSLTFLAILGAALILLLEPLL